MDITGITYFVITYITFSVSILQTILSLIYPLVFLLQRLRLSVPVVQRLLHDREEMLVPDLDRRMTDHKMDRTEVNACVFVD